MIIITTIAGLIALAIVLLEAFGKYSPSTSVNQNAPVKTKQHIAIDAPVEKVWNVFTDVNRWPEWQKDIPTAMIDGPVKAGSVIHWKTAGFSIHSQLQTVDEHKKIGWAGKAFGSFAIHIWNFEQYNGQTIVTVEESMEGWLVKLMQGYVQSNLHTATERWLRDLKERSEKNGVQ